jgi:hypothetical protein
MGQTLYPVVVPQSGAPVLLSTTTFSGVTTTVSGINQSYTDLKVVMTGLTNDTANGYNIMKPNNTSTIANVGAIQIGEPDYDAGFTWQFGLADLRLTGRTIDRTTSNNFCEFLIKNYSSTTLYKGFSSTCQYFPANFAYMSEQKFGSFNITTAISSLVFSNTSGGSHTSGTVKIYGIN